MEINSGLLRRIWRGIKAWMRHFELYDDQVARKTGIRLEKIQQGLIYGDVQLNKRELHLFCDNAFGLYNCRTSKTKRNKDNVDKLTDKEDEGIKEMIHLLCSSLEEQGKQDSFKGL